MTDEVTVNMPVSLTKELIDAVRNDPMTAIEDKDDWHAHLGWLVCAYDAMVRQRTGINASLK